MRQRRFDPTCIAIGTALLALTGIGGATVAQVSLDRAERVASPVIEMCASGGPAAVQLDERGACEAAQRAVQIGPYGRGGR